MDINLIKLTFSSMTIVLSVGGVITNFCGGNSITSYVKTVYLYGKFLNKDRPSKLSVRVPKRWFQHFYLEAIVLSSLGLCSMVLVYFFSFIVPQSLITFLLFIGGEIHGARVSACSSLLAMLLLTIQCWKRFYETWFVSIFSDSKIDASVYIVGHVHYIGAILAILLEAPGFSENSLGEAHLNLKQLLSDLRPQDIAASLLFFWAWYQQWVSMVILANLRKNKKGDVVTLKHCVPEGGLFDWVSSPHLLCEILIYLSLAVILQGNSTWNYVFTWVLVNQVLVCLQSHSWYKAEFKNYPEKRYAVIPFIL